MGACQGKLHGTKGVADENYQRKQDEQAILSPAIDDPPKDSPRAKGSPHGASNETVDSLKHSSAHTSPRLAAVDGTSAKIINDTSKNGKSRDVDPSQNLSAEELVEQYHRQSNALLDTVDRLKQVVRKGQLRRKKKNRKETGSKRCPGRILASDAPSGGGPEPQSPAADAVERSNSSSDSNFSDATSFRSCLSRASLFTELASDHAESLAAPSLDLGRDALILEARQQFQDGQMLSARSSLQQLCKHRSLELKDLSKQSAELGFDVDELLSHCDMIDETLAALEDDKGYSVSRDAEGLCVLYKCHRGRVHYIKMTATLPHPLERPLALAREFDLMSSWNHFVKDSSLLHAPSIWESWVYAGLWMPFPFPEIDALATGRGFDLSEEDHSLLVCMRSIPQKEVPEGAQELPHRASKRKRMNVVRGSCIRLEALPPAEDGTPRTKGTILAIVEPHIPHVPAFIINFVLGVLAPFAHRQIARLLEAEFDDPTKPFPQRMASHPELYDHVRSVVRAGMKKHYGIDT